MFYLMADIATTLSEAAGRAGLGNLLPGHNFAISISDPAQKDNPIIAISDEFEAMTGYSAQEIVGSSARFLREDCPDNFHHLMELHSTSITGKPFIGVLTNTRRDGRPFLKLLDQRGFTVAANTQTGEEHWFLLSLHLDVTDLLDTIDEETLEGRIPEIEAVMNRMLSTSEIVEKIMMMMCVLHQRLPLMQKQEWQMLSNPTWR
jgi:PAS domain-containing protein